MKEIDRTEFLHYIDEMNESEYYFYKYYSLKPDSERVHDASMYHLRFQLALEMMYKAEMLSEKERDGLLNVSKRRLFNFHNEMKEEL